ncbi:MAG: YccF domain-containing protein [Bacteroidales bacterium]|nr:YccF domain-containing protein [Bacteroidales bacterium]
MKNILGNIIWLIFGGLETAIEYFIGSVVLMITIIGIPFGLQTLKLGVLTLWPFGQQVYHRETSWGCLNLFMNVLWFIIAGIWIGLTHILFGALLAITIIGLPFARQHFKLARLSIRPFGYEVY